MRMRFTVQEAIDTLGEVVGVKSGLLLSDWKLIEFVSRSHEDVRKNVAMLWSAGEWWELPRDEEFVMRAEEFEGAFIALLNLVGAIPDMRAPNDLVREFVQLNRVALGLAGC